MESTTAKDTFYNLDDASLGIPSGSGYGTG
jgi:hypothetical protein